MIDLNCLRACRYGGIIFAILAVWTPVRGQELEPRAYASAPVGLHAVLGVYSRSDGSVLLDPTLPAEDVTAGVNTTAFGYFHSLDLFGRFANIGLTVPYAWGSMEGRWLGDFTRITRSGLGDPRFRFAFNLAGAPALRPADFATYRQKTNLGLSFTLSAPLGQYDPDKLINLGTNRWAFKPELGLSHATGRWLLEAAGGVWLLGTNHQFLGASERKQSPVLSLQGHVTYNLPKRMWVAFDANFFEGGGTRVDGVQSSSPSLRNSRFGVTFSVPVYRRHSFKVSYDNGVITRLGSDFSRLSIAYQFVWLGLR
jgi:hypothetical protein